MRTLPGLYYLPIGGGMAIVHRQGCLLIYATGELHQLAENLVA